MRATLADVAARAGVSLATASRVINKSSHNVTPELKKRVLDAVRELNYVPNAHAQALVKKQTTTVGVIVHDISDPYFAQIARGIQKVASEAERLLIICNSYRNPDRELAYIDLLRSQRVDAIILAGSGLNNLDFNHSVSKQIEGFISSGGKVAFIGRHYTPGNAVLPDNVGGALLMGRFLVEQGHQHIGVITGPATLTTTDDRLKGFHIALEEAGLQLPESYIIEGDFSRDGGTLAMQELLARDLPLSAVFALNDPMAIGAMSVLRANRIHVPQDISVAGFDDIPMAEDINPALTTIHIPLIELGRKAMEMVLSENESSQFEIRHVPSKLVIRESVVEFGR
ncbi:MAG: LacI family transcriptional regulator [Chloroflexi bacterium]|nr:LacI family transcriptional regulator [Chloroflexota bacterium]